MEVLLTMGSTVCASLPMLAFLSAVWWLDRYDREPLHLLAAAFLWGAIPAVLLALIVSGLGAAGIGVALQAMGGDVWFDAASMHMALTTTFVAPIVEEPAKGIILLFLLLSRHFDNMTDGFVYGAAAGLGFGMTENYFYFVSTVDQFDVWLGTVAIRTLFSAVMHATATAILGAAIGWARFRGIGSILAAGGIGLTLAIALHATWNGLLVFGSLLESGFAFVLDLALMPMAVILTFLVFQGCLWNEATVIRSELNDEVSRGLIPADHPAILGSWWRRIRKGWLPPTIHRERYVSLATTLAMRKHQQRLLRGRSADRYAEEVEHLRVAIRECLGAPQPEPVRGRPST